MTYKNYVLNRYTDFGKWVVDICAPNDIDCDNLLAVTYE